MNWKGAEAHSIDGKAADLEKSPETWAAPESREAGHITVFF